MVVSSFFFLSVTHLFSSALFSLYSSLVFLFCFVFISFYSVCFFFSFSFLICFLGFYFLIPFPFFWFSSVFYTSFSIFPLSTHIHFSLHQEHLFDVYFSFIHAIHFSYTPATSFFPFLNLCVWWIYFFHTHCRLFERTKTYCIHVYIFQIHD